MARVEIVKAYMKARTANNADEVGTYVADDIVLVSERDGTKTGKEEFLAYVRVRRGAPDLLRAAGAAAATERLGGWRSPALARCVLQATPSNGTFQDPVEEGDKVVLNGTVSVRHPARRSPRHWLTRS